jgi:PTH1 family peptidyl-tRNA hydrolase
VKLIVGLGNPGARYALTRHNVGFHVVDRLADVAGLSCQAGRVRALLAQGMLRAQTVLLVKPQTFMNESGLAVSALVRFYKLDLADLLVICDDLDLPAGRMRLREQGSSGGQRGVASIIQQIGSNAFPRLRVGIGRPSDPRIDPVDHVLSVPQGVERETLEAGERRAVEAVQVWLSEGIAVAMNQFNPDPQAKPKPAPTDTTAASNE